MAVSDGLESLRSQGFAVFTGAVPTHLCDAVLDALAQECDVDVDDPSTWHNVSTELDQVPLWNHQALWDIRQMPALHDIWSRIYEQDDLWTDLNSCRVTIPAEVGGPGPLHLHLDVDPREREVFWFAGVVALTPCREGQGGFRCAPSMIGDESTWPEVWTTTKFGTEYWPNSDGHQIVEVPLAKGDLLIFDSRLPHGTVANHASTPRAVFYVQLHPAGTEEQRVERLADFDAGLCPPWWRWKPGHDRIQRCDPTLTDLGRRLLGSKP